MNYDTLIYPAFLVSWLIVGILLAILVSGARARKGLRMVLALDKVIIGRMLLSMVEDSYDSDGFTSRQAELLDLVTVPLGIQVIRNIDPKTNEEMTSFSPKVYTRLDELEEDLNSTYGLYTQLIGDTIMIVDKAWLEKRAREKDARDTIQS